MLIAGKEYDKPLFVHIPKTAGTSILNVLKDKGLDPWDRRSVEYPRGHLPFSVLQKQHISNETIFSFAVVRNPYTRTYSCFKQFNKTNKTNISFVQYLNNIKTNNISTITPLLHLPQYLYLTNENDIITVDKIYRFENLIELQYDFGWQLGFDNAGNYVVELYNKDYTNETIDLVHKIYKSDFERFGYSEQFEKLGE